FHLFTQGKTSGDREVKYSIGVSKSKKEQTIKINQQKIKNRSELATTLPIQLINPDAHKLLEDAPRYRRNFLNWGVFHVEHSYVNWWREYQQILKQRNAALKSRWSRKACSVWDDKLVQVALKITECRTHYVNQLQAMMQQWEVVEKNFPSLELHYYQGWSSAKTYLQVLDECWDKDLKSGITSVGPHRCDLKIMLLDGLAKEVVSRGQQKLLTTILKIAQIRLLNSELQMRPVLLIDDIASELDKYNLEKIFHLFSDVECQVFITAIHKRDLHSLESSWPTKMFHVEHGCFQEMV
ncbi:DNA replication/repair protein RecF, partial [Kaarinaea lacus]